MPEEEQDYCCYEEKNEREIEKLVGIEIFSTVECEGIGGEYKTNFKDFIVKEITNKGKILEIKEDYQGARFSEDSNDRYTTFNLVKLNKETFEAIRDISKALGTSSALIQYAGLKDKCSLSVQRVSIRGNYVEKLKRLRIKDLFFRSVEPSKKPVLLGSNWGNNFTIIIRNIEIKHNVESNIKNIVNFLEAKGFPNYYGLQRFGTYRPNSHIVGRYLLEGNYKKAYEEYLTTVYSTESQLLQQIRSDLGKDGDLEKAYKRFPKNLFYERQMVKSLAEHPKDYVATFKVVPQELKNLLVCAFQSYLFNRMISLRVKKGFSLFKPEVGDSISILDDENGHITQIRYIYGRLNGLYDKALDEAINLNRAAIVVPLVGYNSELDEYPLIKKLFEEILKEENIDENIFKNQLFDTAEFKGAFRTMVVKPIGLQVVEFINDDLYPGKKKLRIEYSLPKGSYATMLLRELIK